MTKDIDFGRIDFDFWSNTKRDIVMELLTHRPTFSISDIHRAIGKSYSVTYKHILELKEKGILSLHSKNGSTMVSLKKGDIALSEIFMD